MGNMMEDKTVDMLEDLTETLLNTISTGQDIVGNAMKRDQSRKAQKALLDHFEKGGRLSHFEVSSDFTQRVAKQLEKEGIYYEVAPVFGSNTDVFLIKDTDQEKFNDIIVRGKFDLEHGKVSEMTHQDFIRDNFSKNIVSYKDLTAEEVEQFRENSFFVKLPFAVEKNREADTYNIHVSQDYKNTAEKVMLNTIWDLTGPGKDTRLKQIEHDIKTIDEIMEKSKEPEVEKFYAVSSRNINEWIEITDNSFDYCKDGSRIEEMHKVEENDLDYEMSLCNRIREMDTPIVLSAEEFELNREKKRELIKSKDERPKFTKEEIEQIQAERNSSVEIIENKVLSNINNLELKEVTAETVSDVLNCPIHDNQELVAEHVREAYEDYRGISREYSKIRETDVKELKQILSIYESKDKSYTREEKVTEKTYEKEEVRGQ